MRLIDLFREWDDDGNGALDKKEMRAAVAALGYEAPKFAIDELFDMIDVDKSGWIEFHELKFALSDKGVKEAKARAERARKVPGADRIRQPSPSCDPRAHQPSPPPSCSPAVGSMRPSCSPAVGPM